MTEWPLDEQSWVSILKLGREVDRRLQAGDVRLTMGGEPTFVLAGEPDAPEWNIAAEGGRKRELGDRMLRRLRARFASGGALHHGLGKWYPGEALPRWAFSCFFRLDGEPLFRDEALIGRETDAESWSVNDAERLIRSIAARLFPGGATVALMPAFEDEWYRSWQERRLPINVEGDAPASARSSVLPGESALRHDAKPAGFVLPLRHEAHDSKSRGWVTGPFFLRNERCILVPGGAPLGARLPLDSLPWIAPEDVTWTPSDPTQEQPSLPPRDKLGQPVPLREFSASDTARAPELGESARDVVRTAMCVQPRSGHLYVFLPPLETLEAYAELVAAVEESARDERLTVRLEGYGPPADPRLGSFSVTPDPGVLEINVHPVATFDALVEQTEAVYALARDEGLTAEKFDPEGAHVASGGGSHLTLGGPTPLDSPLLRRPRLLGSLLRFWQNYPGLSYLFAGRFIGPTSQAPRVDEARDDSLYELEIALEELAARSEADPPPWLADRLLRHLLVDVTGNTHRSEFCIDKLYAPDDVGFRLGLLEMRAFEMPLHERMAVLQQLLVRAAVAAFWDHPYDQPLRRFGARLHDAFLLPAYVEQDLEAALSVLARSGLEFDSSWFAAQRDFRFPLLGVVELEDAGPRARVEVRAALEPWLVLGEAATGGGQSRPVDSSLERLEIRTVGVEDADFAVAYRGVELPLAPTGRLGERACGVRFRARQIVECLHPTIPVHSPLRFSIFDRRAQRAIAGFTYHAAHPAGHPVLGRPPDARVAESRRAIRFTKEGHDPTLRVLRPARPNPDYPMTFDLRRERW